MIRAGSECASGPNCIVIAGCGLLSVCPTPFLFVSSFAVFLAAEDVETVAHVQHDVGVDAVVVRVAPGCGIHPSVEVALLPENVVEVEGYDKRLVLEEAF